jgi:hypothetical protein
VRVWSNVDGQPVVAEGTAIAPAEDTGNGLEGHSVDLLAEIAGALDTTVAIFGPETLRVPVQFDGYLLRLDDLPKRVDEAQRRQGLTEVEARRRRNAQRRNRAR